MLLSNIEGDDCDNYLIMIPLSCSELWCVEIMDGHGLIRDSPNFHSDIKRENFCFLLPSASFITRVGGGSHKIGWCFGRIKTLLQVWRHLQIQWGDCIN